MAQGDIYDQVAAKLYEQLPKNLKQPTLGDYAAMPGQGMMETTHSIATGIGLGSEDAAAELERRRPPGSDTLTGQVLTGAGSTVPFLASGGVGAAAEALGASAATAGTLTTATVGALGMAAEGGGAYQRAKAAGATDEQAMAAGWLTAPIGLTEIIPTAQWAQRFGGVLKRVERAAPDLIKRMATEGAENALQEVGQTYWENLIAKEIHSPEEAASLVEAAQVAPSSFIVGALFGAASHYYAAHAPTEAAQEPAASVPPVPEPAAAEAPGIVVPPPAVPLDSGVTVTGQPEVEPQAPSDTVTPAADPTPEVMDLNAPMGSPMGADESVLGATIGRKMQGTLDNTLPPGVKPVSKQQVMDSYMNVLRSAGSDSPMLQGGVPTWAAGTFNPLTNTVRQTIWGDLATASHEIGHALERAVFGFDPANSPWSGAKPQAGNVTPNMQGELYRLGKKLYGNTVPNGGYLREGHAEYMRLWLTNHDVLMQEAPNFTKWFETDFLAKHPEVQQSLLAARESSDTWRRQGAELRAASQRFQQNAPEVRIQRALKEVNYNKAMQAWVRGEQAFVAFEKHMEQRLGRKLNASERVVDMADSVRLLANSTLAQQVRENTTLEDGVTVTGKSLDEVLAPIRGREDEFFNTVYARTAVARWNFREAAIDPATGKPIQGVSVASPRDPGLSLEDAEHILATADPIMLKATDDLAAWLNRVNDLIESIDPELGAKLKTLGDAQDALHPGGWDNFWAPLRRWIEDLEGTSAGRSQGAASRARTADVTKRAKGSGRPVKDILPEMLSVVRDRLEMAYRRAPLLRALEIADAHPEYAAPFLRRAGEEAQVAAATAVAAARQPLIDAGEHPDTIDAVGPISSFFSKPFIPPGGRDPIVPVYRNGTLEYWEMDKSLYTGLIQINQTKLRNFIAIAANKAKNLQVMTATGLRPVFGLVLNPMVDLPSFVLNTKYYTNPVSALASWMRYSIYALVDGCTNGRLHETLKDPSYDVYKKLNLEYGQSYHVNANRTDVTASRLFKTKTQKLLSPANFVDFVAQILSSTEKAARVSEVRGYLKEIGWDGKRPLTPEEVMLARVSSKQVTVDYTQAGDMARQINQFVPFFNAPIQGTVALTRAAKHHPYRFAAYMAGFVGASLALWQKNRDDDDYQELPMDERARYWHFPVTVNGRKEWFRWKKPQEIAAITSVFEELFDAGYRKRDPSFGEMGATVAQLLAPPLPVPSALSEPLQLALNKDFYTGNDIAPDRMASLDAAGYAYEQKTDFTSRGAEAIGRALNVAPLKVDHFMRTFFGGLGRDTLDTIGLGIDLNQREKVASDIPLLGPAFKRGGPMNQQAVSFQDFYRTLEIADGRSKSREHPETFEQAQIRKMLLDAGAAINAMQYVRDTYLKTNKERDEMLRDMAAIAKQANAMAVQGIWDPVTFEMQKQIQNAKRNAYDLNAGVIPRSLR